MRRREDSLRPFWPFLIGWDGETGISASIPADMSAHFPVQEHKKSTHPLISVGAFRVPGSKRRSETPGRRRAKGGAKSRRLRVSSHTLPRLVNGAVPLYDGRMDITITPEMLEAARAVNRANGRKGGKAWWASLTDEERKERIGNMVRKRLSKPDVSPTEPPC